MGRRKIEYTILEFNYDDEGTYISTLVIQVTAKFNRRFDKLKLRGGLKVFNADQDPLDPTELPVFVADVAPFTARRIPVGR